MIDKAGNIIDRREMLKVKVKSLAEEARIIRREEERTRGVLRDELHRHRVGELRHHARAAHLAYGIVKGRTYEQMERKASTARRQEEIDRMVKRYGPVPASPLRRVA